MSGSGVVDGVVVGGGEGLAVRGIAIQGFFMFFHKSCDVPRLLELDWIASHNTQCPGQQLLNPHLPVKHTRGECSWLCLHLVVMVMCGYCSAGRDDGVGTWQLSVLPLHAGGIQ